MPWTRAVDLEIGMKTGGGLEVHAITHSGPLYTVTWAKDGKRRAPIMYHPDQSFDIQEVPNMAQKVTIEMTSDLSEKPDASTIAFGIDGKDYEIDLTDKEASTLRDVLAKYVGAARPVRGTPGARKRAAAASSGPSAKDVRDWAKSNGHEVPERGRIPAEVREAFDAAH